MLLVDSNAMFVIARQLLSGEKHECLPATLRTNFMTHVAAYLSGEVNLPYPITCICTVVLFNERCVEMILVRW